MPWCWCPAGALGAAIVAGVLLRYPEKCQRSFLRMRSAALIIAGLDAALSIFIVCDLLFFSASDQATRGFDFAAVWIVGILFAFTAFPALLLAGSGRAPRAALALAVGFPVSFAVAFLAVVIAFW